MAVVLVIAVTVSSHVAPVTLQKMKQVGQDDGSLV